MNRGPLSSLHSTVGSGARLSNDGDGLHGKSLACSEGRVRRGTEGPEWLQTRREPVAAEADGFLQVVC